MAVTSADFWDRIAPKYSRQPIADPESYARKLAATQALMQPDSGQRRATVSGSRRG